MPLAGEAATAKSQRLSQRTPERRVASLACYAERLLAEAHDDVLLILVHDLAARSERSVERDRIRTLDQPDAAALTLRQAALVVPCPSYLERLGAELDAAYYAAADAVTEDPTVWIEDVGSRDRVHVAQLDRLSEPASTSVLRADTHTLLPQVELPELLLKVQAGTGSLDEFTHASGAAARLQDLALSAQACNIGYRPVAHRDVPALTPARLEWVEANFFRPETLTAANNRLIAYHQTIGLTHRCGSGEVASADGLRLVVPVRSVHAGPNPHYFGTGRGVTYFNWSSDQFTSWAAIVVPGTLRDSQFILDGLLDNTSGSLAR